MSGVFYTNRRWFRFSRSAPNPAIPARVYLACLPRKKAFSADRHGIRRQQPRAIQERREQLGPALLFRRSAFSPGVNECKSERERGNEG